MTAEEQRALRGIELIDIGQALTLLGEQLTSIGRSVQSALPSHSAAADAYENLWGEELNDWEDEMRQRQRDEISRTLTGLNAFRSSYSYWERLTVEFALERMDFTQRRTATLLGVALGTVNRWAQHPLTEEPEA